MVLSDIAPHRESVAHSGCGLLLPEATQAWVEALRALASDRARVAQMGRAAPGAALAYSLDRTVHNLFTMDRDLTSARQRASDPVLAA